MNSFPDCLSFFMNSYTQQQLHFYFSFLIYIPESLMFIAMRIICSLQLHLSLAIGKKLVWSQVRAMWLPILIATGGLPGR
jgi:hypothetical protein